MATTKIAITLDGKTLGRLDHLVKNESLPNRSRAIEAAVLEMLERMDRGRLARQCAKLDRSAEMSMAEEGMTDDFPAWRGLNEIIA